MIVDALLARLERALDSPGISLVAAYAQLAFLQTLYSVPKHPPVGHAACKEFHSYYDERTPSPVGNPFRLWKILARLDLNVPMRYGGPSVTRARFWKSKQA